MAAGDLTEKQRNELLASMTDEVAQLVLRDNYEQNTALSQRRSAVARPCSTCTRTGPAGWSGKGLLDRALEFLPTASRSPSGSRPSRA